MIENRNIEGFRATYRYVAAAYVPYATATDALVITGASGKVIRVTKVIVRGKATAASQYDVYLTKRTTANTGGTATNPTPSLADSADPAAAATLALYSVIPTSLGTGTILAGNRSFLPAAATPVATDDSTKWDFGTRNEKAPVLRSATESLAVNFGGAAVPAGANLYIEIEWTEGVL